VNAPLSLAALRWGSVTDETALGPGDYRAFSAHIQDEKWFV